MLLLTRLMIGVALVAGALEASSQPVPPSASQPRETKDRLPLEAMEQLVAGPMDVVRGRGLAAGEAAFAQLLRDAREKEGVASLKAADLLSSFGVLLFREQAESEDSATAQASLKYLAESVGAYKAVFGPIHPEVALALNSHSDALLELAPDKRRPPEATAMLEEALKIRLATLGLQNAETVSTMVRLANDNAEWGKGDPAHVAAAESLYRQALRGASSAPEADSVTSSISIRLKLAMLYADNGKPDEAVEETRQALNDSLAWPDYQRCFLIATDVAEIVETLVKKGHAEASERLPQETTARCFNDEEEAPAEPIAVLLRTLDQITNG